MSVQDDRYKTLYLCKNRACARYYMLAVAVDEPAQKCPKSESHGFMTVAEDDVCWGWNTCETQGCENHLLMAVPTKGNNCEKCNQAVVLVSSVDLDGLPDAREAAQPKEMHGSLRTLKADIKKNEDWTTSHHSSTTSKGAKKTGTTSALQRHQGADSADSVQRKQKVKFLNESLTKVIEWKLRKDKNQEVISPYEQKQYAKLCARAGSLIKSLDGIPVTENDISV
jgi:hypothetical protein